MTVAPPNMQQAREGLKILYYNLSERTLMTLAPFFKDSTTRTDTAHDPYRAPTPQPRHSAAAEKRGKLRTPPVNERIQKDPDMIRLARLEKILMYVA